MEDISTGPAGSFLSPVSAKHKSQLKNIIETSVEFEAKHKECVRVLPYSDGGDAKVHLYVLCGKSGVPQKLKVAAKECFGKMEVKLEWLDLYKDADEILKISPVEYPSGAPKTLNESQGNEINEIISKNLHVLVRHRNITAMQASLKITKSKQTVEPCIAFYVLRKGVIPDGECAFPPTLGSYPVDVVDGFWFRTDDPWTPNKAQEQSEVLCLGASIGVREEEAAGTLGAIVKGGETFYALSCDHVMKHPEKSEIIHPALNDHLNYLNYHLQQYGMRIKHIIHLDSCHTLKTQFSFGNLTTLEELSNKFQELKSIKETHLDPARVTKRKLNAVDLHEKAFEEGLTPPRVIGRYIAGVSRNVRWTDGEKYYIDAAIAKLSSAEVNSLRQNQTAEMIGTGDCPSGKCSSKVKAIGELCKSGRTTEFTKSGRHVEPSVFLNTPLYEVNVQNEQLISVLKRVKLCQSCMERSGIPEISESTSSPCNSCKEHTTTLCDSLWLKNCLCIDHPFDLGKEKVFATEGDSGAVLFERDEHKSLLGFGIIFGEHRHSHKLCVLASPLEVALETLAKQISEDTSLRLLAIYDE